MSTLSSNIRWAFLLPFAASIVSCGSAPVDESVELSTEAPAAKDPLISGEPQETIDSSLSEDAVTDFGSVRAGDRSDVFLRRSSSPSESRAVQQAAAQAVDDCVAASGFTPLPRGTEPVLAHVDLRISDVALFRATFGYGVVENLRAQLASSEPREDLDELIPDPEILEAYSSCSEASFPILADASPPPDLNARADTLRLSYETDDQYVAASLKWVNCMAGAGLDDDARVVPGPFFSQGIVEELVFPIIDRALQAGGEPDFDELQLIELEVFEADSACLASSGAGDVMLGIETEILATLIEEFPSYRPPSTDPGGDLW